LGKTTLLTNGEAAFGIHYRHNENAQNQKFRSFVDLKALKNFSLPDRELVRLVERFRNQVILTYSPTKRQAL